MIIESKVIFPKKKFRLKKSKEEIERVMKIYENHRRITFGKENSKTKIEHENRKEYEFIIYTDGGYSNGYNVGSWSYFIKVKYNKKHFKLYKESGIIVDVAKRLPILMEITAVIQALKYITNEKTKKHYGYTIKSITVYSDSSQVVQSERMFKLYEENNWFYIRKNYEMLDELKYAWNELHKFNEELNVNYAWVRGHSGNLGNERCNKVCATRLGQAIKLKKIMSYNSKRL